MELSRDEELARRRALIAVAQTAQETADEARRLMENLAEEQSPRERIRAWRRLRLLTLSGLDRQTIHELLSGATWAEVGAAYGLHESEVRARFEQTVESWREPAPEALPDPTGPFSMPMPDSDTADQAEMLDAWLSRHAEPWSSVAEPGPVTRALNGPPSR